MSATTTERKSKMFWVVEDSQVRYLKCWECTGSEDLWWCPQAGFSGSSKHHFFDTEKTALEKLISSLSKAQSEIASLLAKSVKRYSKL